MMYFAYGSNLNLDDLSLWCRECGQKDGFLEFQSEGILENYQARFTFYGQRRRGGVLDVVPCIGATIRGALFAVRDEEGWQSLDMKEGVPDVYRRVRVRVSRPDGSMMDATTYEIMSELREPFVQPSKEYVSVVLDGLEKWGIDKDHINEAAAGKIG